MKNQETKFEKSKATVSIDFKEWQDFLYYSKLVGSSGSEEIRKFIKKRLVELKKKVR